MVWRGVIIEESLDDKSILNLVSIVKSRKTTLENESEREFLTFLCIKLEDKNKDIFIRKTLTSIRNKFYIHIIKENNMVVIYKNKLFEFSSKELNKLNEARKYGLSIGILKEQMSFEELIKNPYG